MLAPAARPPSSPHSQTRAQGTRPRARKSARATTTSQEALGSRRGASPVPAPPLVRARARCRPSVIYSPKRPWLELGMAPHASLRTTARARGGGWHGIFSQTVRAGVAGGPGPGARCALAEGDNAAECARKGKGQSGENAAEE
ncbi:hypothetical protein AcV7_006024 [Taiwanofungus camphoratus]|nr:hypothetical protein AcV7_006024 [Antrodia cinnamomea]